MTAVTEAVPFAERRKKIGKRDAVHFYPSWSRGDRANAALILDALGADSFYTIPSNVYVTCLRGNTLVARLRPGYIEFANGYSVPWALIDGEGKPWFPTTAYRANKTGNVRVVTAR